MKLYTIFEKADGVYELRSCEVIDDGDVYRYADVYEKAFPFRMVMAKDDPRYATTPRKALDSKYQALCEERALFYRKAEHISDHIFELGLIAQEYPKHDDSS